MRLAIDMQACQTDSRDRGIGRYAFSLVSTLARNHADAFDISLILDAVDRDRLSELRSRIRKSMLSSCTATWSYPSHEHFTDHRPLLKQSAGLIKGKSLEALSPDALLVTTFFETGSRYSTEYDWSVAPSYNRAVIAYDLIPLLYPEHYLPEGQFITDWYKAKIEQFKQFELFLAISEATKSDMVELLGIDEKRIVMIGAGLDVHFAAADQSSDGETLVALGIFAPFILTVGNADWRKNCMGALEAFSRLPPDLRQSHQLVFTRVGEDVISALNGTHASIADRVVVLGSVSEDVLARLYRSCRLFFFPSLYEGFGLPVLEAMAAGAPVLSSGKGALAEVVPHPEMLFDPLDLDAAGASLGNILRDDRLRHKIQADARDHALSFTWERTARLAAEALRSLQAKDHPRRDHWRPSAKEVGLLADALTLADRTPLPELADALKRINKGTARRILVDITEVFRLDARSGIQRVVRNYCSGLYSAALGTANEVVPICWTEAGIMDASGYARDKLGLEHIDTVNDGIQVEPQPNDLVFMVDSSWWMPERFDEFHAGVMAAGGEIIWMVYDLIPLLVPDTCDPGMPPAFLSWLTHAARTTDGFICISEATRIDLERFLDEQKTSKRPRPWTRSLHLGCDLESGSQSGQPSVRLQALLDGLQGVPKFLAVGTVEPRKDYRTILAAFEELWEDGQDVALFIVGKHGWNVETLVARLKNHERTGERLFWLEGLSDADLQALIENCDALIQASLAEGFGLPVVEAGSKGKPLLLSDIPVFREIAGDEAEYFSPQVPGELADIIRRGLKDGVVWKTPAGIHSMTWAQSSQRLLLILLGAESSTKLIKTSRIKETL